MKKILSALWVKILAAFLIFMGFGMIHGSSQTVEKAGSVLIGIGAFYFIVFLVFNRKREQD